MQKPATGTRRSWPLLIFLHLPKTAGSTMARILERQYGSSGVLTLYDSFFGEELASVPQSQLDRVSIIIGHFYFGVHAFLSRLSTYVTMLRDPVDRVISHYYFVRRDPTHYLHPSTLEMSLSEYVNSCGLREPNNDQTRLLAGKDSSPSDEICTPEMLPVAKKNLLDHIAVVGLTEEFDRSLILIKRVLGWRKPFYIKQNVSPRHPGKEDISLEKLSVIQAYNALDYDLYCYGKDLLQDQVSSQGDSFEREVRIFQIMNAFNSMLHLLMGLANKKRLKPEATTYRRKSNADTPPPRHL